VKYRWKARNSPSYVVGKIGLYYPAEGKPSPWSDMRVITDAVDGAGNPVPDMVVGQRDILPLPDGNVAVMLGDRIANYSDPGFDPATLDYFAYGKIVDEFSVPTDFSLTAGYVIEVMYTSPRPLPGVPNVGDLVVAYKPHLYLERDEYAFIRVFRALNSGVDYGYYAMAEVV